MYAFLLLKKIYCLIEFTLSRFLCSSWTSSNHCFHILCVSYDCWGWEIPSPRVLSVALVITHWSRDLSLNTHHEVDQQWRNKKCHKSIVELCSFNYGTDVSFQRHHPLCSGDRKQLHKNPNPTSAGFLFCPMFFFLCDRFNPEVFSQTTLVSNFSTLQVLKCIGIWMT